jgi:RNA polymerase sigma factor (sigma-70 family)
MQSFKQLTEKELVQAYINGAEQAISELVQRTKSKVYTAIYMLVKDKYLAEDILQEVYIKAVHKLKANAYANDGKFSAWLCKIARNLCMDYFRSIQNKAKKITLSDGRDIFEYLDFPVQNEEDKVIKMESGNRVKKLLEYIPQDQRDVIVMRLYSDMSFKEIAEETNTTINTCLGRMRYGLINLRKLIEQKQLVM